MKTLVLPSLVIAAWLQIGTKPVPRASAGPETFVDHEKVASCTKGGSFFTSKEYTVICYSRKGPGQVEIHERTTHVLYFTDGEATLVVGGSPIDGKPTGPGEVRAASVEGGASRHVVPGDVIVIPAGTPHWFKEVPRSVSYFSVNPLRP
jgi:quercetin dioxygenase-like cupin family protein